MVPWDLTRVDRVYIIDDIIRNPGIKIPFPLSHFLESEDLKGGFPKPKYDLMPPTYCINARKHVCILNLSLVAYPGI